MSESQSRYSIVSNLTKDKLAIMDEKQAIESSIAQKKGHILKLKKDKASKVIEQRAQNASELALFDSEIAREEQEVRAAEFGKTTKAKLCDDKIAQIDKALQAVQDISKASVEEAKA